MKSIAQRFLNFADPAFLRRIALYTLTFNFPLGFIRMTGQPIHSEVYPASDGLYPKPCIHPDSRITIHDSRIMQNKPNFPKSQMTLTIYKKMTYENNRNWTLGEKKPKQTHFAGNQSSFILNHLNGKPNVKQVEIGLSSFAVSKYGKMDIWSNEKTNPKQTQFPIILVSLNWLCIISLRSGDKVMHRMPGYGNFIGDFKKWQMHRKQTQ